MSVPSWSPSSEISRKEAVLLKRCTRHRKLFAFLRRVRHELFDEAFQQELATMYRGTQQGRVPVPPALLAMATLLQAYVGASDAEAVELSLVDARWQMVLDRLGDDDPAFSQGALHAFRERLIAHDMDRRLLERTVEFARRTKEFDWAKLPKTLRLAVDSRPLEGAARVDDTINLLGRAARKLLRCAASLVGEKPAELARLLDVPLLHGRTSVKALLDADWDDPEQRADALAELLEQIDALEQWVHDSLSDHTHGPPLADCLQTLDQIRQQDLDPDPNDGGPKVRRGVAADRRISVEDGDMRHGRKTKSKTINGYKSHLGTDLDTKLILACNVTPANQPEKQALPAIETDLARYSHRAIGELHIDLGYLASPLARRVANTADADVVCKPRKVRNGTRYSKLDFDINLRDKTVTCPVGVTVPFDFGATASFPAWHCDVCPVRYRCTTARKGQGRSLSISADERLLKRLRKAAATPTGRRRLRQRNAVEHRLAHHAQKQGRRARYRGIRKNIFDARRHAAVVNLETIHHRRTFANAA